MQQKIKILVISNYRDTHVMRPEAEAFIRLANRGFDITVMTYPDAEYNKRFEQNGIKTIGFHPDKKNDKKSIDFIRKTLKNEKYDIVHLFNNKSITNGIKAAKGLPVKVVLYRGYTGNVHWWDPTAYTKFLHPRVDKITCLTDSVRDSIAKNMIFANPDKKLITINKGHNVEWYDNKPLNLQQEFGIPQDAFVVVNVGNERRMKGTKYLLKSTYFLPKGLNIYYLVVGHNRDKGENKKIAENSPYCEKIIFTGKRSDALDIVAASDVFVLSSIKGEAITKSVIEAMSLGITPVISDIAGNKNLVINNESGIVFRNKHPEDIALAVTHLYHNRDLLEKYGKNARERIRTHFNIERTVKEAEEFYKSIVV